MRVSTTGLSASERARMLEAIGHAVAADLRVNSQDDGASYETNLGAISAERLGAHVMRLVSRAVNSARDEAGI